MAKKNSKKAKKESKGPKGKKARASAKLDRQWGETIESETPAQSADRLNKLRKGRARLTDVPSRKVDPVVVRREKLKRYEGVVDRYHTEEVVVEEEDDEDSSESEGEGTTGMNSLLDTISSFGKKKRKRMDGSSSSTNTGNGNRINGDDTVMNDSSSDDEEDDDTEDGSIPSENDNHNDDDNTNTTTKINKEEYREMIATMKPIGVNPFHRHFFNDTTNTNLVTTPSTPKPSTRQKMTKASTPQLHPNIILQCSDQVRHSHSCYDTTTTTTTNNNNNNNNAVTTQTAAMESFSHIRPELSTHWHEVNAPSLGNNIDSSHTTPDNNDDGNTAMCFSNLQSTLYPALSNYVDLHLSTIIGGSSTSTCTNNNNLEAVDNILALHILNHVLTSNHVISKNNAILNKRRAKEDAKAAVDDKTRRANGKNKYKRGKSSTTSSTTIKEVTPAARIGVDEEEEEEEYRDQGYTRPKVLLLLPTRAIAYDFVQRMIRLLGLSDDDDTNTNPNTNTNGTNGTKTPKKKTNVENSPRFRTEFGPLPTPPPTTPEEKRREKILREKGPAWNALFGDGVNDDDDFKIGLSFQKRQNKGGGGGGKKTGSGTKVKLYSDFYHSDVLIASPLGLKMCCFAADEDEDDSDDSDSSSNNNNKKSKNDVDFLSSIEVLLVHHADTILMQNWDHLNTILYRGINRQPISTHSTIDFSRVRNYLLTGGESSGESENGDSGEGGAAKRRQTIICSQIDDPYIGATFHRVTAGSISGRIKMRRRVLLDDGEEEHGSSSSGGGGGRGASLGDVIGGGMGRAGALRQVFQRVPCQSIATQGESRLRYFKSTVLPQLLRPDDHNNNNNNTTVLSTTSLHEQQQKYTLLYIPSYFDFISIRNLLTKLEASFVSITEYARVSEVSRGRARFAQGRKPLMLYTGRAHFFGRHMIKGVRHLVMYGLPEHGEFYPGFVNLLLGGEDGDGDVGGRSCLSLFTKYDGFALERIVGTRHAERMMRGDKSAYLFSS